MKKNTIKTFVTGLCLLVASQAFAQQDVETSAEQYQKTRGADPNVIVSEKATADNEVFHLDFQNLTNEKVYVYINKEYAFMLEPKGEWSNWQVKGYGLKGDVELYAKSEADKFKWGPVDVDKSNNGGSWKLNK